MTPYSTSGIAEAGEAQATFSTWAPSASAIGLMILGLQVLPPGVAISHGTVYSPSLTESTGVAGVEAVAIDNLALFEALGRVYDVMRENSADLSVEDRRLIYQNLWDLYA